MPEQERRKKVTRFVIKAGDEGIVRELIDAAHDVPEEDLEEAVGRIPNEHLRRVVRGAGRLRDVEVHRIDDGPTTELLIRGLDPAAAQKFKTASGARGMRYADYLAALVKLHDEMRSAAAEGDERATRVLEELNLTTVTV
ncbi:MAG TPA: hypothetical protein VNE62_01405 [Actinomycetota bacterium]|nr:hypothetical protein [Actinomycetota bacterium]